MNLPRIIRHNRSAYRRLVAGSLLVAIVLGITGVPLPTWADKDLSVAFPCMHRQCGCRNAAACWNSCCCHTNSEKLAWAKRHGIEAPKFVVAAAARETKATRTAGSCCSSRAKQPASCCDQDKVAKAPSSCCADQVQTASDRSSKDWVRLEDARRCHGQTELWLMLSQIAPIESAFQLDCRPLPQDWLSLRSNHAEILSSYPGQRPPRTTV